MKRRSLWAFLFGTSAAAAATPAPSQIGDLVIRVTMDDQVSGAFAALLERIEKLELNSLDGEKLARATAEAIRKAGLD